MFRVPSRDSREDYIDFGDGCLRRNVLETDNFKMLVTVFAILVIKILYYITLVSGTNTQKISPDLNSVANILKLSPAVSHQHHNVTNMTVA